MSSSPTAVKDPVRRNFVGYCIARSFAFLLDCIILSPVLWALNFVVSNQISTVPLMVAYYLCFYLSGFESLGQKILGLRVSDYKTGAFPRRGQAALRAVLKPVFLLFAVLPLMPFFPNRRSFLDLLCGTAIKDE